MIMLSLGMQSVGEFGGGNVVIVPFSKVLSLA